MFFSVWHLAVPVLVLIALIALIAGGYDKRTILKSTGSSLLIFYCMVTLPVGLITQENMHRNETMIEKLDGQFEKRREHVDELTDVQPYIVVHVGAFSDGDDSELLVYAGNYHESQSFTGNVLLWVYDHDEEIVFTENYQNVTLQPGEKKELDSTFTSRNMETYTFEFEAQPR
ncbi:MAG: hypothetical protein ACQEXX_04900 [Bacillota bacterium]